MRRKPDAHRKGYWLYNAGDLEKAFAILAAKGDEYRDESGRWIWVAKAAKEYELSCQKITGWCNKRCVWIGRKVRNRTHLVRVPGAKKARWRLYVCQNDLDLIERAQAATKNGKWILTSEVSKRLDRNASIVSHWRRHGNPLMGREKLLAKKLSKGARIHVHNARQVDLIAKTLESLKAGPKDGQDALARADDLAAKYGYSGRTMRNWRRKGFAGVKVRGERIPAECGQCRQVQWVWFLNEADVRRIIELKAKEKSKTPNNGNGQGWPGVSEVADRLGISEGLVYNWCKHGCPLNDDKPLTTRKDLHSIPMSCKKGRCDYLGVYRYRRLTCDPDQVAKIEARLNALRASAGIAEVDGDRYVPTCLAVRKLGVHRGTLAGWHHDGCRHIGGRQLRATKLPFPYGHKRWRWGYHEGDLEEIIRRRSGLETEPADQVSSEPLETARQEPARDVVELPHDQQQEHAAGVEQTADAPAVQQQQRKAGGRPRERRVEAMESMIREHADWRFKELAKEFNRRFAQQIKAGKGPEATSKWVKSVKWNMRQRESRIRKARA